VTVLDMMGVSNFIRVQTFRVYEPLLAAAVIYILLTFIIAGIFRLLEARLNRDRVAPVKLAIPELIADVH
jgi:ABC-type arginine/histidine transport system permease subunit